MDHAIMHVVSRFGSRLDLPILDTIIHSRVALFPKNFFKIFLEIIILKPNVSSQYKTKLSATDTYITKLSKWTMASYYKLHQKYFSKIVKIWDFFSCLKWTYTIKKFI